MLDTVVPTSDQLGNYTQPAMPTMDGFLSDFARKNPDLAWLTQMLAAQRAATTVAVEEPIVIDDRRQAEIEALTEQLAIADTRAAKLQRIARRQAADLEAAQVLLADLASAFGACGLCWGQDPGCLSCRGRGKPGRFAPDPDLRLRFFAEPVEPQAAPPISTAPDATQRR